MESREGSVMIALLPTSSEWSTLELPHLTLVYAGEITDLQPGDFNDLSKDAASLAIVSAPVILKVMGVETFGSSDEEKVNALRFMPTPELLAMRRFVERWNRSEHDFKPHSTMGPVSALPGNISAVLPRYVTFDRLTVGWGDDYITFNLRRGGSY